MFVKICGLTNREDSMAAVEAGAKAIGFVFASSPRRADPDRIAKWIGEVPPGIWRVGVFVDEAPARIEEIGGQLGLDIAQLHGGETPECHPRGLRVWKACRVSDQSASVADYPAEAILVDGPAFDWSKTEHFHRPLILAGGLNPANVESALRRVREHYSPWAVDVASGIEAEPGRKDHTRMKQFIEAALRA